MPKYISRNQFEQMKVLKKRKSSNKAIAEALGMSPATVSRNLRYNSYEDYLISMYGRNSKSQKEVEAKSGPVRIVSSGKKAYKKCGKTKPLEEFDIVKDNRDGRSGTCKECRRERQRKYKKAKTSANKSSTTAEPDVKTKLDWLFKLTDEHDRRLKRIEDELDEKFHSDESAEEEQSDGRGLEPRVGEVLNIFIEGKVRRVEIMGSREVRDFGCYEKRYLVRYKKFFGHKYADVSENMLYTD